MIRAEVSYLKLALVIGNFNQNEVRNFAENHSVLIFCSYSINNIHSLIRMLINESCSMIDLFIKNSDYSENEIIFDTFVFLLSKHKYIKTNIIKEN